MGNIELAIIVPVSNHADLTRECLMYLYHHTAYHPALVIVVDDGSTDETPELLRVFAKSHSSFGWVAHDEQQGFAQSCNDGIKKAMEYSNITHVLLLNNDIEVWREEWLDTLVSPFAEDERLVVGPDYVDYNSATLVDGEMVPYIGGWCIVFPIALVKEIGMLDTAFNPAFYEDVEFSARAEDAGYRLVGLGDVGIHHLYGKTTLDGRFDVDAIHLRNQPVFEEKIRVLRGATVEKMVAEVPRWAFCCPGNMVFDDSYLEGEGLGGAESALVQLTRSLARLGVDVHIINDCPVPGRYNGVFYRPLPEMFTDARLSGIDVFVLFRVTMLPHLWPRVESVPHKWFWSCDQYTTLDWRQNIFPYVDKIVAISDHHARFLQSYWGADPEKVTVLPLGVTPADFEVVLPKIAGRLIYCSVPDRGLKYLADMLPLIQERVPGVSLTITGDYTLWGSPDPLNEEFKALFAGMKDVQFLGKVPRQRLVQEMLQAELHIYPCDYTVQIPYTDVKDEGENFCLASLECQAAGTPTIATPNGALRTTVDHGMSGYLIDGHYPGEDAFTERFVNVVSELLSTHRPQLQLMRSYARDRALTQFSWDRLARQWLRLAEGARR